MILTSFPGLLVSLTALTQLCRPAAILQSRCARIRPLTQLCRPPRALYLLGNFPGLLTSLTALTQLYRRPLRPTIVDRGGSTARVSEASAPVVVQAGWPACAPITTAPGVTDSVNSTADGRCQVQNTRAARFISVAQCTSSAAQIEFGGGGTRRLWWHSLVMSVHYVYLASLIMLMALELAI